MYLTDSQFLLITPKILMSCKIISPYFIESSILLWRGNFVPIYIYNCIFKIINK